MAPCALGLAAVRAADEWGFDLGRALSTVVPADVEGTDTAELGPALELPEPIFRVETGPTDSAAVSGPDAARRPAAPARRQASRGAEPVSGVYVSAEVVLRLANAGVRPTGVPARPTKDRPGGVELRGVSALGLGPRDGDVLTMVEGQAASSVGAVAAAVIGARSRGAAFVTGRAWRGATPYAIRVGMPYPKAAPVEQGQLAVRDMPPAAAAYSASATERASTSSGASVP